MSKVKILPNDRKILMRKITNGINDLGKFIKICLINFLLQKISCEVVGISINEKILHINLVKIKEV